MKIGKENMIGCLAAVEWYLSLDHEARRVEWEQQLQLLQETLVGSPGVSVELTWPGEAGESVPRAMVNLTSGQSRLDRDGLVAALRDGDPRIAVGVTSNGISVYPATLQDGEMAIVAKRLAELLR